MKPHWINSWIWKDEFSGLTYEEFNQYMECMWRTKERWDLIVRDMENEYWKYVDEQLNNMCWTKAFRQCGKTETVWNLFRLYMKRKYNFHMPELFVVDWESLPADENAYIMGIDWTKDYKGD